MDEAELLDKLNYLCKNYIDRLQRGDIMNAVYDFNDLMELTRGFENHPEKYVGPCECNTCLKRMLTEKSGDAHK